MSYFRASTGNPLGWRNNNTVTLGNMIRHAGPDWKTVAAKHDAAIRAGKQIRQARQRVVQRNMSAIDAAARGDRVRVRMPRLSGLGSLSSATQMVNGAQYTFHFQKTGVTLGDTDMGALAATVAADGNFLTPVASVEQNGFQVRFIYNGPGTTASDNVGNMGAEMQKVINDKNANGIGVFSQALFSSAEGGPQLAPGSQGAQVFIGPDGILRDASGNVISANTSTPGDQSNNNNGGGSPFDWTSFWEGMGLSAGIGTALTVGLAVLIFKNS